jgi:hypothetical protein
MKNKTKKKKDEFVYLVYCNKEPIVYGLYKSKHDAVRYAVTLIRYRKEKAKEQGKEFGYYHFHPLPQPSQLRWMKDSTGPYYHDITIFTACLSIREDKDVEWGDDGCHVRVIRRVLN